MNCIKKAYTIKIEDWLTEKNVSDDIFYDIEHGMWEYFFRDDIDNDCFKLIRLNNFNDITCNEYCSLEIKTAIPYVKEFVKELKEEGIEEILIEFNW